MIQPHADLTVSYHDLREASRSDIEAGNREQRAKDLSQAHASAPFDLSRDLPVRVLLLQLADEAHVVQVVMHHIASDGWSVGVFLQELSALYGSFIAEQGDPLAPLPLQYADYAAWQRRWLAAASWRSKARSGKRTCPARRRWNCRRFVASAEAILRAQASR
ncbi:condensation domain-containing protein [Burkholderia pseudomallei]